MPHRIENHLGDFVAEQGCATAFAAYNHVHMQRFFAIVIGSQIECRNIDQNVAIAELFRHLAHALHRQTNLSDALRYAHVQCVLGAGTNHPIGFQAVALLEAHHAVAQGAIVARFGWRGAVIIPRQREDRGECAHARIMLIWLECGAHSKAWPAALGLNVQIMLKHFLKLAIHL